MRKTKIVLIGGHPKGYNVPFHPKTKSGRVLRKIIAETGSNPVLFNLWKNQKEEDSRKLGKKTKNELHYFSKSNFKIIALGRYIEETLAKNGFSCGYLPHPASRNYKYIKTLKKGLTKIG